MISRGRRFSTAPFLRGYVHDSREVKNLFEVSEWVRIGVILGDRGYDTKTCFESIAEKDAVLGDKGEEKRSNQG